MTSDDLSRVHYHVFVLTNVCALWIMHSIHLMCSGKMQTLLYQINDVCLYKNVMYNDI